MGTLLMSPRPSQVMKVPRRILPLIRAMKTSSMCLGRRCALTDAQHDLFRTGHDLELVRSLLESKVFKGLSNALFYGTASILVHLSYAPVFQKMFKYAPLYLC